MVKINILISMVCMMLLPAVNGGAYIPCEDYYGRTGIVSVVGDVTENRNFCDAAGWEGGGIATGPCSWGMCPAVETDRNCTAGTDGGASFAWDDPAMNGKKILYASNVDGAVLPDSPHVANYRPLQMVRLDACEGIPPFAAEPRRIMESCGTFYDRPSVIFELDGSEGYAPCCGIDRRRHRRSECARGSAGMYLREQAFSMPGTSVCLLAGIGILGVGSLLRKRGMKTPFR